MINSSYFWLNVFFLAIGTLAIRYSFIALSSKVNISSNARELFSFIPAAILPALIAPGVFFHQGSVQLLWGKERFLVLALSSVICLITRSTLATICFGLILLFSLKNFL